jgi:hypothetical protein
VQVHGIQSNNISACVKHFIFNNHECNRGTFSASVDERTGRELYAPAFFAAVDAGVGSVMCAFNRVNNTFSCQSDGALTGLLKRAGGFRGWVVSDWGAQHDAIASANSGLDQEMEYKADSNRTAHNTIGFGNPQFVEAINNGSVHSGKYVTLLPIATAVGGGAGGGGGRDNRCCMCCRHSRYLRWEGPTQCDMIPCTKSYLCPVLNAHASNGGTCL